MRYATVVFIALSGAVCVGPGLASADTLAPRSVVLAQLTTAKPIYSCRVCTAERIDPRTHKPMCMKWKVVKSTTPCKSTTP